MAAAVRLIVTDNSTAASTMADRIVQGKARRSAAHGVPVFHAEGCATPSVVIGLGGLLFAPTGDPPEWQPARRAPTRALRALARTADLVVLATADPLLGRQARDVACEGRSDLLRRVRVADAELSGLTHLDELAAHARAVDLEIDALVAAHLSHIDPLLTRRDLRALGGVARRRALGSELAGVAERGYVAGDPPWLAPAGTLILGELASHLVDGTFADDADRSVDAVGRGTLAPDVALVRIRTALQAAPRPAAVAGLDRGRMIGLCPECGDWMAGARGRVTCMGCGHWYGLPRQVEALAVPGQTCPACAAPLIVPVVRGRRAEVRCPDGVGCPTRIGAGVGA